MIESLGSEVDSAIAETMAIAAELSRGSEGASGI